MQRTTLVNTTVEEQKVQAIREGVQILRAVAQNLQSISATLQRMEVKRK